MIGGILVGYLLRGKRLGALGHIVTVLIWALLFLLGIEVGSNPRIVNGITTLGLEALAITIAGCAGSVAMAWALWKVCAKNDRQQ